ncbi:MAG: biofilm PGA synthesis N-glycosyltransferase PgaC, partial [Candidatus Omnitrophota bacterium]
MLVFIFWLLIVLIIYCYFGYPLILKGLTFLFTKPVKRDIFEPSVSILISVWNEADVIKGKLRNLLALDYPEDKFEIIIGADGCTDKTIEIINSIDDP